MKLSVLRPDISIHETSFGILQKEWFNAIDIENSDGKIDIMQVADVTLRKYLINIDSSTTVDKFTKFINSFLEDTDRVKGFINLENKSYYLDCVGNMFKMAAHNTDEIEASQINKVVVLASKGMNTQSAIKNAIKLYPMAALIK